jgi:aromatic ring-opening dioxygenase catalytic subunit (LigB family)
MSGENSKQPALFIPHGGGPCFFMEWDPPGTWVKMAEYLKSIPNSLPRRPSAIIIISGHWEEGEFTVTSSAHPSLIYDYQGFPPHTYELQYPAPGAPALAERISKLGGARQDPERGFDHGVFIPLKVAFPDADIPVVQLSLKAGLDPEEHIEVGHAIAQLRLENNLIIGSGMSYHNLPRFFRGRDVAAESFDNWLLETVTMKDVAERERRLIAWARAPGAHDAHPREEHLIPLMVAAGAGGSDPGTRVYSDRVNGIALSGFRFG